MRSSAGNHCNVVPVSVTRFLVVLFAGTSAASVAAQSSRDIIGAGSLGAGYSRVLSLTATPDISSAHLDVSDGDVPQSLTVTRIPYEGNLLEFSDRNSIGWRVSGGYFREKDEFPIDTPGGAAGSVASEWSAFSATGGLFLKS